MEVIMNLPSGILNVAFNKLGSVILQQIGMVWDLADNLDKLKDVMEIIKDGLEAAEEQAIEDKQLSEWLRKVHDVAYDVDDQLYELRMKTEEYEWKMNENKLGSKLSGVFSKHNPAFRYKVAKKIEGFEEKLEELAKLKKNFHFEKYLGKGMTLKNDPRTTVSYTDTEKVIGRKEDKETIRNEVTKVDGHMKVSIISIIGLGGLGKTTLAQLVYNDDIVQKHFKLRMWIYVSQNFDTRRLMRALFEELCGYTPVIEELNTLGGKIKDKLKGHNFLLVLDDVWDHDRNEWEIFSSLLSVSEAGSKIIVTTRSTNVAKNLGSTFEHNVERLSDDDSWTLFKQRAFRSDSEELDPELVKIGKEILRKCGGVPLAVKALGSILRSEEGIEGWKLVRDSNVWRQPEGDKVMKSLILSYYRLPSHLKQCFTICSVFPKGYRIDKEQLIDLWIAHDMISLADGVDHLEYNGKKCFSSLVQMSFLQDVDEGFNGRVTCRMHDLVHDLARSILGDEISDVVPEKTTDARKSYRYFSLIEQTGNVPPKGLFEKACAMYVANGDLIFEKPQKNARYLRSITMERIGTKSMLAVVLQIKNLRYLHMSGLECETLPEAISKNWSLQSLHITDSYRLREITKSIGKLKKLRTLNLSGCVSLLSLPDSVCACCMISTLDLTWCNSIEEIPDSIGRNKKLRVLRLCHSKIKRLPSGITALENLECLDIRECVGISELPEGMWNLKRLKVLNLEGCCKLCGLPAGITALENLECLDIRECVGISELPEGMGNLKKLEVLNLEGCEKLCGLPAGITALENLECLDLHRCVEIRELPEGMGNLKKLEVLNLEGCKELCGLPAGFGQLTGLHKLGLFAVGAGENSARISELGTLGKISGRLTILNIECVSDPGDASKACLKEKAKICELTLEWGSGTTIMDSTAAEEVLEALEPPSQIEILSIVGYPGVRFPPRWMLRQHGDDESTCSSSSGTCFPRLFHLHIHGCPKLEAKPHLPSSIESLFLFESNEQLLQSPFRQDQGCWSSSDAGLPPPPSFSHLKELRLFRMTAAESESGRWWQLLQHLTAALESLDVFHCEGLTELPESMRSLVTSLRSLKISMCSDLRALPEWLGELRSLRRLDLQYLRALTCLPQSIGRLTSLERLWINNCKGITCLPQEMKGLTALRKLHLQNLPGLTCLPQSIGRSPCLSSLALPHLATSLQELTIESIDALHQLPEWLWELRSLRILELWDLPGLTCLPQSIGRITSLERLHIRECEGIDSLPAEIKGLPALRQLIIFGCPILEGRCERGRGQDWHLISHIPHLQEEWIIGGCSESHVGRLISWRIMGHQGA